MKLILVRGLPGSGKSTFAAASFPTVKLIEADDYFYKDGVYLFNREEIRKAHIDCQSRTTDHIKAGYSVVVANTFTRLWEMRFYFNLAFENEMDFLVYRCEGNFGSIHGVPQKVISQMRHRFEPFAPEIVVDNQSSLLVKPETSRKTNPPVSRP